MAMPVDQYEVFPKAIEAASLNQDVFILDLVFIFSQ